MNNKEYLKFLINVKKDEEIDEALFEIIKRAPDHRYKKILELFGQHCIDEVIKNLKSN